MNNRILVLGASSFIGQHLVSRLGKQRALGTYNRTCIEDTVRYDSLTMNLKDCVGALRSFSHAVILLGDTQPDSCFSNPIESQRLNVDSICSLIDTLINEQIKIVFLSSEFVFDGAKGNYVEEDVPRPILLYGKQKLCVENYIAKLGICATILRLAKVYGETPGDGTLFVNWLSAIQRGQKIIECAVDQRFSPVHVEDVVDAILRAVNQDISGTFHVSGNQPYRRLELLNMLLAEIKKYHSVSTIVMPRSIHEFDLPEKRPVDVSMSADKLISQSEFSPRDIRRSCADLVAKVI